MSYVLAFLISFLGGWSVAASDVLFREEHRPGIFARTPGTALLLALTAVGGLFVAGGILWIFQAIKSSGVLVIIAGGGWLGFEASNRLHVNASGASNRLFIGVGGLVILYGLAWTFFRPPVDF